MLCESKTLTPSPLEVLADHDTPTPRKKHTGRPLLSPEQRRLRQKLRHHRWYEAHKSEVKLRNARWAKDHPDNFRAIQNRYRKKHPDKAKASAYRWRTKHSEQKKAAARKWHQKNIEKQRKYSREYNKSHAEKCKARLKEWRANNQERIRLTTAKWRLANKDKLRLKYRQQGKQQQLRRKTDPEYHERMREYHNNWHRALPKDAPYRIASLIRGRVFRALRYGYGTKSKRTLELLGCSIPELKVHLEKQFKDGMTWANAGTWHLDHQIPCASFDLRDPVEQAKCFHYSNLQPLWGVDNLRKGSRVAGGTLD